MIASYSQNFVFIKTRKTAGTSVEIVLSSWCSSEDIISPMIPEDEMLRLDYEGLPRNFGGPPELSSAYIQAVAQRDLQEAERLHMALRKPLRQNGFFCHMPALKVRNKLPELWERAFTFAVERHPYEKAISRAYWWRTSQVDSRPIGEIIEDVISHPNFSDKRRYTEGDKVIVDKIIDFDQLWPSLRDFSASIGKSVPNDLPRAKGHARKDRRPAREILTASQRQTIFERSQFEFELMGFER